jgi:ActR/RegA family two-component response regulator
VGTSRIGHFGLIVEPQASLRQLLAEALAARGYVVHTSESVDSATALASHVSFSVLVAGPGVLARSEAAALNALLKGESLLRSVVLHDPRLSKAELKAATAVIRTVDCRQEDLMLAALRLILPLAQELEKASTRVQRGSRPA